MGGTLYIISTPIGNPEDITLRALRILNEADAIICEERRIGSRLLAQFNIDKPLVELNEHSTREDINVMVERLRSGETLGLISDHGTPLVQDPGGELVNATLRSGFAVVPVPGASSILAALVVSGIASPRFRFIGMLPAKKQERTQRLVELRERRDSMIFLDAPYRMIPLLESLCGAFGAERKVTVSCNLTQDDEKIVRGECREVLADFKSKAFKGEFVVVVAGEHQRAR